MPTCRLIVAKNVTGKLYVTAIKCHWCGSEIWDYTGTQPGLAFEDGGTAAVNIYHCVKCKHRLLMEDGKALMEAADDKAGWFARRHKK